MYSCSTRPTSAESRSKPSTTDRITGSTLGAGSGIGRLSSRRPARTPFSSARPLETGRPPSRTTTDRAPSKTTLGPVFRARTSADASRCTSGAPGLTWLFGSTKTCRTVPAKGAATAVSIFMASTITSRSPAATSSPGSTCTETTTAGEPARTTPSSAREIACGMPSTSMSSVYPVMAASTR